MRQALTFKSDDEFYNTLNQMVKSVKTTKSELIRKSVLYYQKSLEREKLKEQIREASFNVREASLKTTKEFETTLDDGLESV